MATVAQSGFFAIVDADNGERFSTTDYGSYERAVRERDRLALKYGKEFCLEVWAILADGSLTEVEVAP